MREGVTNLVFASLEVSNWKLMCLSVDGFCFFFLNGSFKLLGIELFMVF